MGEKGLKPLISDNTIYYHKISGMTVLSYVDDSLLIGPDQNNLQVLKNSLKKKSLWMISAIQNGSLELGFEDLRPQAALD